MDPGSAFGLAVNLATLIDLGVKVVRIYRDGTSHGSLKESADQMNDLCQKIRVTDLVTQPTVVGSVERGLQDCAMKCMEKAEALQKELTPRKGPQRLVKSIKYAFSDKFGRLEGELRLLHEELDTRLLVRIRYVAISHSLLVGRSCINDIFYILYSEKIDLNEVRTSEQFESLDTSIKNMFIQFCDSNTNALDFVLDKNNKKLLDCFDEILRYREERDRKDLSERRNRFLESLTYGNPFTRVNDIQSEHDGTCEWIFDRADSGFSSWLQSGKGIFWIQGKAGSGKSTMVKFVCESFHVMNVLEQCVPTRAPLVVSFYFWMGAGANMQNTQKGLLCSLLHQFLEACWELDSSYLSDNQLRQKKTPSNWEPAKLKTLLLQVVAKIATIKTVCIFVDGLDECHADDLSSVIETIKDLKELDIKLCVSSRPEHKIINQLQSASKILNIEECTQNDIRKFVIDQLGEVESDSSTLSSKQLNTLSEHLVGQAEGVFLWAILVSKDIRKGIENGDSYGQLLERVQQTPGNVTALYEQMLERLGPDLEHYKSEAAAYFWGVIIGERFHMIAYRYQLLPVVGNFLPIYADFQNIDFRNRRQDPEVILSKVEKRITTVCGGMLNVTEGMPDPLDEDNFSDPFYRRVTLIHRTARDFLSESGRGILESCEMSQFSIYCSIVDGYTEKWLSYGEINLFIVMGALQTLESTSPTTDEALKFLFHFDESMERVCQSKQWLYKHCKTTEDLPILPFGEAVDFLGGTVLWGKTTVLLDHVLQNDASLSQRYKDYLLLLLCRFPEGYSKHIGILLEMGANPNEEFYTMLRVGRTRSSPWMDCLRYYYFFFHHSINTDPGILQALIDKGANLDDRTIGQLSVDISNRVRLDLQHGILETEDEEFQMIQMILELNARSCMELYTGVSLEELPWCTDSSLPPAYLRVLLVRPPEQSISEMEYEDDAHPSVVVDDLSSKKLTDLVDSLISFNYNIRDGIPIPPAPDELINHAKDDITELCREGRTVDAKDYLSDKGYYRSSTDPAAIFPDYESFRGEDGEIDVNALLSH